MSGLSWSTRCSSAPCLLNLLDKVQKRAEHLISDARQQPHPQQLWRQQQQQQQQQQRQEDKQVLRDTLDHHFEQ
ncbi:hypothetical protein E2C01_070571 [Portunus trituberculatus]|uniref:Uncharacterized protein n=1 Tax=Portunus trituberculatus TaxID=210409 RepID=A0A5B7I1Z1_PORTR|nr:hypothetical protein [Portunus trituberculatus]